MSSPPFHVYLQKCTVMYTFTMLTFLSLLTFARFITTSEVENSEWKRLYKEFKLRLAPIHHLIGKCSDPEDLKVLGNRVSIETFCLENKELFEEKVEKDSEKFVQHPNKTISELETLKKVLKKEALKEGAGPEKKEKNSMTLSKRSVNLKQRKSLSKISKL